MRPAYYVIDTATNTPIPAVIRPAAWRDFQKTENEYWQTSWLSKFIQQDALEKYALELRGWHLAFSFPLIMAMVAQFT